MEALRSSVSRASLIMAVGRFRNTPVEEYSQLLGFIKEQEELPEETERAEVSTTNFGSKRIDAPFSPDQVEIEVEAPRYWRQHSYKALDKDSPTRTKPDWYFTARSFVNDRNGYAAPKGLTPPAKPPLIPWSRLWPFLRLVLGQLNYQRSIDVELATERLSRCKPLYRLPYRQKHGWANSCQIILDCDNRLIPLWDDMTELGHQLRKLRGRYGCSVLVFEDGPFGPCRDLDNMQNRSQCYPFPPPQTPVLVLSDLGLLDPTGNRKKAWLEFGKVIGLAGFAPVALTLCPPRLWDEETARYWQMFSWDRGEQLPRVNGYNAGWSYQESGGNKNLDKGVDQLLAMLAPCINIEPDLLRAARLVQTQDQADVATEVAIWRHSDVRSEVLGFCFESSAVELYRQQFKNRIDKELQDEVRSLIEKYHCNISPLIFQEERFNFGTLTDNVALITEAEETLQRLLVTLDTDKKQARDLVESLKALVRRRIDRTGDEQLAMSYVLQAAFLKTYLTEILNNDDLDLRGIKVTDFPWLFESKDEPQQWYLCQHGRDTLLITTERDDDRIDISDIRSSISLFDVEFVAGETSESSVVKAEEFSSFCLDLQDKDQLIIRSDIEELKLEAISKPPWAKRISCEHNELIVTLHNDRRLFWFNPGRHSVQLKDKLTLVDIANGFWWDEDSYNGWKNHALYDHSWADETGVDEYGIYADFSVGKVTQRMRWVWPDTFLMGSPESEPERFTDETQYEVILSKGFWLADTTCTQKLWLEIMNNNPSRFKGNNLPVETVPWNDCQRFILTVNELMPGLDLRLPTEAEWELACRAKTVSPFSWGWNITIDQVNYDGNYPYNKGKEEKYRQTTVAVKSLPCNNWGFYELHGNVWEWCNDWYANYPSRPVVDPVGPVTGTGRVLRGGGWPHFARHCRSACRRNYKPNLCFDFVGFRLARSQ